jgi:hypothetical protein
MPYRLLVLIALLATAVGAEPLKQGFHDEVPVPGTAWTFDAFLPTGYDAHPDRRYPALFLSSPGANPDNRPWHAWASRRGFVVISINHTKNDISWTEIDRIQQATVDAAMAAVRIHRVLRYSSGLSGGAWCSVRLAKHRPDTWAGVHLSGHSGNGDLAPKTCAIAMYAGRADDVHPFKAQEDVGALYRSSGNPIRFIAHDGGHIYGDVTRDLLPLIDFLYYQTVVALPLLTNAERLASVEVLKEDLAGIALLADPSERRGRCEEMATIPQLAKSPLAGGLSTTWMGSVRAQATAATEARDRHFALGSAVVHPLFAGAARDDRKAVQDDLRALQKDKALKDEVRALQALAKVQTAEADADGDPVKQAQVMDGYRQIADRMPDTRAGAAAARRAGR